LRELLVLRLIECSEEKWGGEKWWMVLVVGEKRVVAVAEKTGHAHIEVGPPQEHFLPLLLVEKQHCHPAALAP
jgi:hypothetical protein